MSNYNITEQKRTIAKIPTMEKCERFMANVIRLEVTELVPDINRRMIEIRTETSNHEIIPQHQKDRDHPQIFQKLMFCLAAYEQTLKNKYAGRIRPQISDQGFIDTIDTLVQRRSRSEAFTRLTDIGLQEFLFEQVVVENPDVFSDAAMAVSKQRLSELA